jgi:hypothetical protein
MRPQADLVPGHGRLRTSKMDKSVERTAPITPKKLAEELRIAPLANLNRKPKSEALALVYSLAERYPGLLGMTSTVGIPIGADRFKGSGGSALFLSARICIAVSPGHLGSITK